MGTDEAGRVQQGSFVKHFVTALHTQAMSQFCILFNKCKGNLANFRRIGSVGKSSVPHWQDDTQFEGTMMAFTEATHAA